MKKLMRKIYKRDKRTTGYMLLNGGFRVSLLLILLCGCFVLNAKEDGLLVDQSDSLLQLLSKTKKENKQIDIYRSLAFINRDLPAEVSYLQQMFEVSNRVDSIECVYESIVGLTRYYSNDNNLDSLLHWVNYIDSLAAARNESPNQLLDVHNALCRSYLVRGEFGQAMNEAVRQQMLAEKNDYELGFVNSDENLALVYLYTGRYKEAVVAFENSLDLLKNIHNSEFYQLQIAEMLLRAYLLIVEYDKMEVLLNYCETILERIEAGNSIRDKIYQTDESWANLYIYRICLYSNINEPAKANQAIEDLKPYMEEVSKPYILPRYDLAMTYYYCMQKDYEKALHYINESTETENSVLELRVKILRILGRNKEALKVYKKELNNTKERHKIAYIRQINQLQMIQSLNEQELKLQKVHSQEQQMKSQKIQTWVLSIFSIILLISIVFILRNLIHTKKLRAVLFLEKLSLKKTHEDLRVAKEKAENAERMKSNFVANISHEIRTPLNAIVGFSSLLRDSSQEERGEYIRVINDNSGLLLNLVSDVLDLSHLDDINFSMNYQNVCIQNCCQSAIATVEHRLAPNVHIRFKGPEELFWMQTDPNRLQQLLINLLGNSAKFTEEGEIVLEFKVDTEKNEVVFSVTDTGCGIPLEKQESVFNRFEKVNEFKQGAGLGLPISRVIAERLGGSLYVDSSYVNGARLIFIHPFKA